MNLSRTRGPGDLSGPNDPRNPREPLTEKEARSVYAKMRSGEVQEFLNQFVASFPRTNESGAREELPRDPNEFCAKFDAFVIRELIGEFEACAFSDLRARA